MPWKLLAKRTVAATPLTGVVPATLIDSYTMPGGTMGPNGWLKIGSIWSFTGATSTRSPQTRFGGTSINNPPLGTTLLSYRTNMLVINRNNAAVQLVSIVNTSAVPFGANTAAYTPLAIDTTAPVVIDFRGTVAGAGDTLTLEAFAIEVLFGA